MALSHEAVDAISAIVDALLAAFAAAAVTGAFTAVVWPHFASIFMDHSSSPWRVRPANAAESALAPTRTSAIWQTVIIGLAVGTPCWFMIPGLFKIDQWSGYLLVAGIAVHSAIAVRTTLKAKHRSAAGDHWLREHGLTTYEIGVLEKSHVVSVLTNASFYVCWAIAFAVPLRLVAGDNTKFAVPAALAAAAVISPLVMLGEKLDRHLRVANQLQLHLQVACRPGSRLEPLSIRVNRIANLTPADQWQSGMPRDRAALISASVLLQRLLDRNTRALRGLDRAALLDAAQPLFQDLANLAASTRPISSSTAVTNAIRLAFLGDKSVLGSRWAQPHRASDHRAWNPWTVKRVLTIVTSTITVTAASVASLVGIVKALTS